MQLKPDMILTQTDMQVNGDFQATTITATNHMPKATIEATYQPILTSTADDATNGFHSILGSASAAGKTKYISATAGAAVVSSCDGLSVISAPCAGCLATYGYGEMSSSSGVTAYAAGTYGPTFADVKQIHSTASATHQASS